MRMLLIMSNYRPQRRCGKVILSQACVKNSVHRGGGSVWQTPPGQTPPLEQTPPSQCMLGYTPHPVHAGTHDLCSVHAGIHPPPATAADGTHPTGMHSCLFCIFLFVEKHARCNRTRCKWGSRVCMYTYLILKEGRVGRKAGPEVSEEFAQSVVQVLQLLLDSVRHQLYNNKHTFF